MENVRVLTQTAFALLKFDDIFGAHREMVRELPVFKLKEAIALSVDLDPYFADIEWCMAICLCEAGLSPFNESEDFALSVACKVLIKELGQTRIEILRLFIKRYAIATRNIAPYGDLEVIEKAESPGDCIVKLSAFIKWANKRAWNMPEELLLKSESAAATTKIEISKGLVKTMIAIKFHGIHWDELRWNKNLANPPKWLEECRISRGTKSKNNPSVWNPVEIAICLLDKGISITKLDAVFINLKKWREEWEEKSAYLR